MQRCSEPSASWCDDTSLCEPFFSPTTAFPGRTHRYLSANASSSLVVYPFGHGQTYSTFAARLVHATRSIAVVAVANKGARASAFVVVIFARAPPTRAHREVQSLAGFERVFVDAGHSLSVNVTLTGVTAGHTLHVLTDV